MKIQTLKGSVKCAILSLTVALVTLCGLVSKSNAQAVKNIALVHGAFADGSGWKAVYSILSKKGYNVTVVEIPLTSLEDDVAATRTAIKKLGGPCILVGHSWGGTVITEEGTDPKVAALVYVSAFQPDKGESTLQVLQSAPPAPENGVLPPDGEGIVYYDKAKYHAGFCADLSKEQADFMYASQGAFHAKGFVTPISDPAWRHKPSYACLATEDKSLNPVIQHSMYKRSNTKVTEIKGSHVIYISQPEAVAKVIIQAANDVSTKN
jgi:pimeloyl-ACP methyl ester carboxylesterase